MTGINNSCTNFWTLQRGTKYIGYFQMICILLAGLFIMFRFEDIRKEVETHEYRDNESPNDIMIEMYRIKLIVAAVCISTYLIPISLLLAGAIHRVASLLLPWLLCTLAAVTLSIIIPVLCGEITGTEDVVFLINGQALSIFFIVVVYRFYRKLEHENKGCDIKITPSRTTL